MVSQWKMELHSVGRRADVSTPTLLSTVADAHEMIKNVS